MPYKTTATVRPETKRKKLRQTGAAEASEVVVLAVGEYTNWGRVGPSLPWDGKISFAGFGEIDAALISQLDPDVVVSPLVCRNFDCIELAQILDQTGFRGLFRVFTEGLPNPAIVLAEAQALCPNIEIEFVTEIPAKRHRAN